jgi:hypothetical protein
MPSISSPKMNTADEGNITDDLPTEELAKDIGWPRREFEARGIMA